MHVIQEANQIMLRPLPDRTPTRLSLLADHFSLAPKWHPETYALPVFLPFVMPLMILFTKNKETEALGFLFASTPFFMPFSSILLSQSHADMLKLLF